MCGRPRTCSQHLLPSQIDVSQTTAFATFYTDWSCVLQATNCCYRISWTPQSCSSLLPHLYQVNFLLHFCNVRTYMHAKTKFSTPARLANTVLSHIFQYHNLLKLHFSSFTHDPLSGLNWLCALLLNSGIYVSYVISTSYSMFVLLLAMQPIQCFARSLRDSREGHVAILSGLDVTSRNVLAHAPLWILHEVTCKGYTH